MYLKAGDELNLLVTLQRTAKVVNIFRFMIQNIPDSFGFAIYVLVTQAYENSYVPYNILSGDPQYIMNCLYSKVPLKSKKNIIFPKLKINYEDSTIIELLEDCLKFIIIVEPGTVKPSRH